MGLTDNGEKKKEALDLMMVRLRPDGDEPEFPGGLRPVNEVEAR